MKALNMKNLMISGLGAAAMLAATLPAPGMSAEMVKLHAAGSLRGALTAVSAAFKRDTGIAVEMKFGASGLLKDAIAGGEKAEVFASADMGNARALHKQGRSGPVVLFARNQMCALVKPGLTVDTQSVLDRMLDPSVKLGSSTPKNDPSGDYAWEIFEKADALKPGATATLKKKAMQLVGKANSEKAPPGKSIYGVFITRGDVDMFLTYCTNGLAARKDNPALQIVHLPEGLAVGADYGMTVMKDASASAFRYALFIMSADGQKILAENGFISPALQQK